MGQSYGNHQRSGASDTLSGAAPPAARAAVWNASASHVNGPRKGDGIALKLGLKAFLLAVFVSLGAGSLGAKTDPAAQNQQQTPIPNAPVPQATPPLSSVDGPITPGQGTPAPQSSSSKPEVVPPPPPPKPAPQANPQAPAPASGEKDLATFQIQVNFVEVPTIVKDSKGHIVGGLQWQDFEVYENGVKQNLTFFSTDAQPLAVAFVIDSSLPSNVMNNVNASLGAIEGALTPYDEAAVFTYGNGAKEWTGFTGGQTARLPAVLALAKAVGTDPMVPINSGPLGSGCAIVQNGWCVDPNVQQGGSTGNPSFISIPKEIHTLNDAILAAARQLSVVPKEYRRVIYVISDGKEYGSKATWKEVVRYLQTNKTAVYGTLVGSSAEWGIGFIDRIHLPFTMYDNILYKYTAATGGDLDTETSVNGIETSYGKIAVEARTQYTLGYLSHESIYDERYRKIDVRIDRPNLEVIAKPGYYPSAQDYR
jgi:VWFA-related protein